MFYSNNFRFESPNEFEGIDDTNEVDETDEVEETEFSGIPFNCPFRQMDFGYYDYDYMGRQPAPPPQPPPHHGQQTGPQGPPPNHTPQKNQAYSLTGPQTMAVDSGAIRRCIYRNVYIWPRRGRGFWAWLTFVGRRSVAGFRWNGNRWVYFGMDLREIQSFVCH